MRSRTSSGRRDPGIRLGKKAQEHRAEKQCERDLGKV